MFEDDPIADLADITGRVYRPDPMFQNKLGGSSTLNLGDPLPTRGQRDHQRRKEKAQKLKEEANA